MDIKFFKDGYIVSLDDDFERQMRLIMPILINISVVCVLNNSRDVNFLALEPLPQKIAEGVEDAIVNFKVANPEGKMKTLVYSLLVNQTPGAISGESSITPRFYGRGDACGIFDASLDKSIFEYGDIFVTS